MTFHDPNQNSMTIQAQRNILQNSMSFKILSNLDRPCSWYHDCLIFSHRNLPKTKWIPCCWVSYLLYIIKDIKLKKEIRGTLIHGLFILKHMFMLHYCISQNLTSMHSSLLAPLPVSMSVNCDRLTYSFTSENKVINQKIISTENIQFFATFPPVNCPCSLQALNWLHFPFEL